MNIEQKVKDIIVQQLGVDPEKVKPEASFVEDLGADSLDTVELVMAFEEEFGVEIPDEEAEKIRSVGDADRLPQGAREGVVMARRVVVTGIGLVSPLGVGTEATWEGLVAGRTGIGPITRFDATDFSVRIAAEVKGFAVRGVAGAQGGPEVRPLRPLRGGRRRPGAAGSRALDHRRERRPGRGGDRLGDRWAAARSSDNNQDLLREGPEAGVAVLHPRAAIVNMSAGLVAIRTGAKGPNIATCTACSTGAHAIGDAFLYIQHGYCDAAHRRRHRGGDHTAGDRRVRATCGRCRRRNDEPERASRPWDRDRDGFVMGEGAGILVLEELESARRRGAPDHLRGAGLRDERRRVPHHGARPRMATGRPGHGRGLEDAGLRPEDVDYINAHGTSTPLNDRMETVAIKRVFGEHATRLAVSSTKSTTGHLLGAAGGLEAGVTALAVARDVIPPTLNLDNPGRGMRPRLHAPRGASAAGAGGDVQLVRLRRHQRLPGARQAALGGVPPGSPARRGSLRGGRLRTGPLGGLADEKLRARWPASPTPPRSSRSGLPAIASTRPDIKWILSPYRRVRPRGGGAPQGSQRRRARSRCSPTVPDRVEAALRECLARGADAAVHVKGGEATFGDTLAIARVLAAASQGRAVRPRPRRDQGGRQRQLAGRPDGGRAAGPPARGRCHQARGGRRSAGGAPRGGGGHGGHRGPAAVRDHRPEGAQRAALPVPEGHHGLQEGPIQALRRRPSSASTRRRWPAATCRWRGLELPPAKTGGDDPQG